MDTDAITGALDEALDLYKRLAQSDRWKHLPDKDRDFVLTCRASREVRILLSAQPEFKIDRLMSTPTGHAGFGVRFVAQHLFDEGRKRGAIAAVQWLQKVLTAKKERGFQVQALHGIRVTASTPLTSDIRLVPFDELPESEQKQGLLNNRSRYDTYYLPISYASVTPSAALMASVEIEPSLITTEKLDKSNKDSGRNWGSVFGDIRHCLAVSHKEPIVPGPSWFNFEDPDIQSATIFKSATSWPHQELKPMLTPDAKDIDVGQAQQTVSAYYRLKDDGHRERVRTAMAHVHVAFIRSSPADKSVELSIALETLLARSRSDNSSTIARRAAVLTSDDVGTRHDNAEIIRAAYKLRNALMHQGQRPTAVRVRGKRKIQSSEVCRQATDIAIKVIMSVLTFGGLHNWSDLEMRIRIN